MLLFPLPFAPAMAVNPLPNGILAFLNDLKFFMRNLVRVRVGMVWLFMWVHPYLFPCLRAAEIVPASGAPSASTVPE